MSNDLFPQGIFGLLPNIPKSYEQPAIIQPGVDPSNTTRLALTLNPIRRWEFSFEQLFDDPLVNPAFVYSELKTLLGFCLAHGQTTDFLLDDPSENFVGPALNPADSSPNLQARLQLVTDGASNFYSPIQQNIGGQFFEDVTDLGVGGITVYANSELMLQPDHDTGDYTVEGPGLAIPGYSFAGPYLKWNAPPAEPITAQFNFLFRVRFESDKFVFEQFLRGLFTAGGSESTNSSSLKLVTERRKP